MIHVLIHFMFIVTNIQTNPSKLKFTWREVATNDFILNALQGDRRGERCEWPMIMAYRNFVNFVQQYGAAPLRASPFFGLIADEEHKTLLEQILPVVIMENDVRAIVVDALSSSAITFISKKLSIEQHVISLSNQQTAIMIARSFGVHRTSEADASVGVIQTIGRRPEKVEIEKMPCTDSCRMLL